MWFLIVLIIDQLVKHFVVSTSLNVPIIKNIFNLMYVQNTGGMYGMLTNNNWLFVITSLMILIILCVYLLKSVNRNKPQFVIWQFIIAGGVSNLIDRIFRGAVVDFVQLKFFGVFNLADVCIVIGVCLICFLELKEFFESGNNKKSSN